MIIRFFSFLLLALYCVYWMVKAKEAEKKKQKIKQNSLRITFEKLTSWIRDGVVCIQLLGVNIFPFPDTLYSQYIGLILLLIGMSISVLARKQLDTNWTHAYEYQIKKNHSLVIGGIYRYIRHPIYSGL
ncbi:hypothetical protein HY041_01895, partial [Candidatus Roizmanbacteria bacterium]|nr:hypothetical protein [Candidatus Roizmanbacteria bacterium]